MKLLCLLLVTFLSSNLFSDELAGKLQERKTNFSKKADETTKSEYTRATKELKKSGIERSALAVGMQVPSFKIAEKDISEYYKDRPLIIKFYRGHWCPYCIIELKEYQRRLPEIKESGNIIAFSPDQLKVIQKMKDKQDLTLDIFPDLNNEIAKKFGIAFKVDANVVKIYKRNNLDLEASQGNAKGELPMPGTYVVNTKGKIVYAFIDADYTVRADMDKVIKSLKEAK